MPSSSVIVATGLSKRFDSFQAVDHIDFQVKKSSTTALLGGNGAGKTTTLSMLLGLLIPSGGEIRVFGEDMLKNRFAALSRMSFSSPYVELPHRLTVYENLWVYGKLYSLNNLKTRIEELAENLEMTEFLHKKTGKLSSGQKTRVTLAKAMLNRPELLLLDEPTASLDPDTGDWMRSYLEKYRAESGCTILLASHNMAEVERLCDAVLMMKRGKIVDRGTPQELLQRYGRQNMEQVFLDIARSDKE